jgi:hypothetical protein
MVEVAESLPVEEKKFVGGYIPKRLLGHLALYADYNRVSRAVLIESFLIRTLEKAPSTDVLCKGIAERAVDKWKRDRAGGIRTKWPTFLRKTQTALKRKKIPEAYINVILSLIARMRPADHTT